MLSFLFRKCLGESTGSNNKCMFNFIRNAKLFNKVIAILCSRKQCLRVPVAPRAYEHLVLSATTPVWIDIFFQICDLQIFSPIVLFFFFFNSQQCLLCYRHDFDEASWSFFSFMDHTFLPVSSSILKIFISCCASDKWIICSLCWSNSIVCSSLTVTHKCLFLPVIFFLNCELTVSSWSLKLVIFWGYKSDFFSEIIWLSRSTPISK